MIGLVDILNGILPRLRRGDFHQIVRYLPGTVESTARAVMLVSGILLVLLAHALRRRKRRAWAAVGVLLVVNLEDLF